MTNTRGNSSSLSDATLKSLAVAGLLFFGLAVAGLLALSHFQFRTPVSGNAAMAQGKYRAAANLYRQAAIAGDRRASNALGNLYYLGLGVPADYQTAGKYYFESAAAGVADAQLNIGHLFKQGLGVTHDPMRAFAWYNMANASGSPAAEYYMSQISQEWTLSPLQISTALEKWSKLSALIDEGL